MKQYKERVVTEKTDLDVKISNLEIFVNGELFKAVPPKEQSRMNRQLRAMCEYSLILGERIANFSLSEFDTHNPP